MPSLPLVTVVCLCHNQKEYVQDALVSVLLQTYKTIELIIVDDGSSDGSKEQIINFIKNKGNFEFININKPVGNCSAFNQALKLAKGEYIIDLAADDILLSKRVEEGINDFLNSSDNAGVHFSDAFLINKEGDIIRTHYDRNKEGQIIVQPPKGLIFKELIQKYFICPPSMMMKRSMLLALNGYDGNLTYEDFDLWVRSSRDWQYIFNKAPLVKKRIVKGSLSSQQTKWNNKHLNSTFIVCQKVLNLCISKEEFQALRKRCFYEIRICISKGKLSLVPKYLALIRKAKA